MKRWCRTGMVLALGLVIDAAPLRGQIVERERDVKVTGPRGRSIERSIVSERAPGMIDRQVTIQRPGGTYHSNALIERVPASVRPGPPQHGGFGPPGRMGHWGPAPFIGREVIVNNRGGGPGSWLAPLAVGGGLFGLGMFAGSALAAPRPQPVYAVPPPVVVYNPPQPYVATLPPPVPTVIVDPVMDAVARLQSHHDNSRRDGAYTLGRLRDSRAMAPLVDRLKNDGSSEVRIAAATALGEIGDPRAAVYLERVTIYDKKQKVRDAAAVALSRLPHEYIQPDTQPGLTSPAPTRINGQPATTTIPPSTVPLEPEPYERVPPPPVPALSGPGFSNQP